MTKKGKGVKKRYRVRTHSKYLKHFPFKKVPLGMKVLVVYICALAFFYLLYFLIGISLPTTMLLGSVLQGSTATILNLTFIAILILLVYGVTNRKTWSYELGIGWFIFGVINAFAAMFTARQSLFPTIRELSVLSFLILFFINSVIVWYFVSEKKYFKTKNYHGRSVQKKDRVFLYTIASFWAIILLIVSVVSINFYQNTIMIADEILPELNGKHFYKASMLCNDKSADKRDVCYLVLANLEKANKPHVYELCDSIESEFYKFTCYQSIAT